MVTCAECDFSHFFRPTSPQKFLGLVRGHLPKNMTFLHLVGSSSPRRRPPMPSTSEDTGEEESAVYWFAMLEAAVGRGNFRLAAEAQLELEKLGVKVRYGRPRRGRPGRLPVRDGPGGGPHAA